MPGDEIRDLLEAEVKDPEQKTNLLLLDTELSAYFQSQASPEFRSQLKRELLNTAQTLSQTSATHISLIPEVPSIPSKRPLRKWGWPGFTVAAAVIIVSIFMATNGEIWMKNPQSNHQIADSGVKNPRDPGITDPSITIGSSSQDLALQNNNSTHERNGAAKEEAESTALPPGISSGEQPSSDGSQSLPMQSAPALGNSTSDVQQEETLIPFSNELEGIKASGNTSDAADIDRSALNSYNFDLESQAKSSFAADPVSPEASFDFGNPEAAARLESTENAGAASANLNGFREELNPTKAKEIALSLNFTVSGASAIRTNDNRYWISQNGRTLSLSATQDPLTIQYVDENPSAKQGAKLTPDQVLNQARIFISPLEYLPHIDDYAVDVQDLTDHYYVCFTEKSGPWNSVQIWINAYSGQVTQFYGTLYL